jgi:MYXO-CTERM domain-containing protein
MTRVSISVAMLAMLLVSSREALAHFRLNAPASMSDQNAIGDPQKTEPCGQDDGNPPFTVTGDVTEVMTGSMLSISVTETVTHEGHFRVVLAADMSSLPPDPLVTPGGGDPCDSTEIESTPTLPILADGLLPHTARLPDPSTMMVQLPAGMTCTNCTLQIIQYMRNHTAPCFYHHCATVTVTDNPAPVVDGANPGGDAGIGPGGGDDPGGGCCSTNREDAPGAMLLGIAIGAGLLLRRRRR